MKHSELIANLKSDLKPVKPIVSDSKQIALALLLVALGLVFGVFYYSLRPNLLTQLTKTYFYLETSFFLISSVCFIISAVYLSIPGRKVLGFVKAGFASLLFYFIVLFSRTLIPQLMLDKPLHFDAGVSWICIQMITSVGLLPFLSVLISTRRGFFSRIKLASFLMVLSGLMVGSFGIQFFCAADHLAHLLVWHALPQAIIAGLVSMILIYVYKLKSTNSE